MAEPHGPVSVDKLLSERSKYFQEQKIWGKRRLLTFSELRCVVAVQVKVKYLFVVATFELLSKGK